MRPIAPRLENSCEHTLGEDQPDLIQITAAIVVINGQFQRVCRYTFTPEEREQIANGEDVYMLTSPQIPLFPHILRVGPP